MRTLKCILIATVLGLAPMSSAAVLYVDATSGAGGNTTLAGGAAFTPPLNVNPTGLDNNWEERTPFGSSGNIFESGGETPGFDENAPALRTTITGLTPGQQYQVYAFFWEPTSTNEDWNLRAGLTAPATDTSLTLYSSPDATAELGSTGAGLASALTYSTPPTIFLESSRDLRAAQLGIAVANGAGTLAVFVDDRTANTTVNQRAWYDGVGVEAVPEPGSLGLLGVVAIGLIGRRRRSRI